MFYSMSDRFGWTFRETERELGISLDVPTHMLQLILRAIILAERQYHKYLKNRPGRG